MKHESEDRLLQDYLDGRLDADERVATEARLEKDADLARRLEGLRAIGAALRGGPEELSPGFYTRARLRFQESGGGEKRAWFRLLSWETAGVAAAAVLAMAVFLPHVLRQGESSPIFSDREQASAPIAERSTGETQPQAPALEPRGSLQKGRPGDDDAPGIRSRAGLEESAVAEKKAKIEPVRVETAESEFAPDPAAGPVPRQERRLATDAREPGKQVVADAPEPARAAPAPRPEQTLAAAAEESDVQDSLELARAAPPHREPAAAREGGQDMLKETAGRGDSPERKSRLATAGGFADDADRQRAAFHALEGVAELPARLVAPGAVRVIEEREAWEALLRGPAGDALSSLGGFDKRNRLVLIGPREWAVDCSHAELLQEPEVYRVILRPVRTGDAASPGGCAVVLPNDGRSVVIGLGER